MHTANRPRVQYKQWIACGLSEGLREPLSFEKWEGADRRDTRYVCSSGREERHFFNAVYMTFV